MRRPLVPLALGGLVPASIGVACVARIPGFPAALVAAFAAAALLRATFGRDGGAFLPRKALFLLAGIGGGFWSAILLHGMSEARSSALPILAVSTALEILILLARVTPLTGFLVILLASAQVAGSAFAAKDATGLALSVGYMASLVWALVLLERHAASTWEERTEGSARRLKATRGASLPFLAHLRTTALLVVPGFLAGLLVFFAAPRPSPGDEDASEAARAFDGSADVRGAGEPGGASGASEAYTGIGRGASGLKLGDVGRIKRDLTPYFLVRASGRPGDLADLYLRAWAVDTYVGGGWYPAGEGGAGALLRDEDDGAQDGWIELDAGDARRGHDLQVTFLEGLVGRSEGWNLLFLEPEAVRIRLERGGGETARRIVQKADLKRFAPFALAPSDSVRERVVPVDPPEGVLLAAASDASSAPRRANLEFPPELAPLADVARAVVGAETNPYRRARLVEDWLRSRFTYTLAVPDLGPAPTAVVRFVTEARKGHCEYFASAFALLVRSLGHPTRLSFGTRGGDRQEEPGTLVVRGLNAHVWPEVHFRGVGWVGFEPTPPDREAEDADTLPHAASGVYGPEDSHLARRLLGYGAEERRRFWSGLGDAAGRVVQSLGTALSSPWGAAAVLGSGLLAFALLRRGARRRAARAVTGGSANLPPGPYGRALLLLARSGVRRRSTQTAREFGGAVRRILPAGGPHFGALTEAYERERFGGRAPDPAERARAGDALARLEQAIRRKDPAPR